MVVERERRSAAQRQPLPRLDPLRARSHTAKMNLSKDPIALLAYSELMISCQVNGCIEDLQESLVTTASDPVDEWANSMSEKARSLGWSSDSNGSVLCPKHSKNQLDKMPT